MASTPTATSHPVPLEAVIGTEELNRRPARPPNPDAVIGALVALAQTMANAPPTDSKNRRTLRMKN